MKRTHRVRERESTRRKRRRRRRRRRQRRGRRRAVHFFLNRARVPFGFWKNEKRERKTIQTTHQFILLLVFVSRACDDTTTTTEARWSFSLSRFSPLKREERERERERERVYLYSRSNETSFFCRFREINSSKAGKVTSVQKSPQLFFVSFQTLPKSFFFWSSKICLIFTNSS